jgi:hypothetical protein
VQLDATEMPARRAPRVRGKMRLRTLGSLDGRTVAARRAREIADGFAADLGVTINVTVRMAIERAAAMLAIAEDAQARRLAGDLSITLEDLTRLDNAAGRAVRALGIKPRTEHKPQTLREYLARGTGASK